MTDPTIPPTGWGAIGAGIVAGLSGILWWLQRRPARDVEESQADVGVAANRALEKALERLDQEVANLRDQVHQLQARERKLIAYVGALTSLLRQNNIEPPALNLD